MQADTAHETEQSGSDVARHGVSGRAHSVADEDMLRAQVYGLLARVLTQPMSDQTMEIVRGLADVASDSELGDALKSFGELAVRTPRALAEEEYSALFYGMGSGGELHPYASYYLTGFIYEKPLADLRRDLTELGIEPSKLNDEPEDHIAFLMEIMHGLITGELGEGVAPQRQQDFFSRHIAPWATTFFVDLEKAENAKVYMPVGTLGKLFVELENEVFEMVAV